MSPEEIEKLRPLANDDLHLMEIIAKRMVEEATDYGHDMISPYIHGFFIPNDKSGMGCRSSCQRCVYEIEVEKLSDKDEIVIIAGMIHVRCMSRDRNDVI